ncbi:MAG: ABC transporter ATP-binding protein [Lachnospiraceae bacterium]|nr:ABC transporter ATP-binding protein [Lachnospiraceae bacterium]
MKKLLVHLKEYKVESILGPLFKLLEASFELMVPFVIKSIIDTGIANNDKEHIVKMCLILVLLGVVGLISAVTAQYFAAKAAVGFATKLRFSLFSHIQTLSFAEIDKLGTSTLITRMTSDINQVQTGINLFLRLLLRSPFVVIGAMIMAFTIDVKAALVFAVTIPVLSVIIFGIMLVSIPLYKKVQAKLDKVLKTTRDNLVGARVVRAFCKEEAEIEEFNKMNEDFSATQRFVGKISALLNPLTYVIINVAIVILIYVGAIRVEAGIITQGAVIALYNYMSQILVELVKFANLIISVTKAVASGNRIESVFEIENTVKEDNNNGTEPDKQAPIVEFRNVGMSYVDNQEETISDISFTVNKGETIGIIGGTGSGKSTLINLLPRYYDADSGEVLIYGKNVKEYSFEQLNNMIGMVLQKAVLFKGTIRDNIRWGKKNATDEEINEALTLAQAKEIVDRKEGGLDYMVEQGGKNFSGGQRQRLTIARTLVKRSEILILDDSSSALDNATDKNLREAIAKLSYKPTVFIVSQRTSAIENADKILVLDDGKLVAMGTHSELVKKCDIYKEIYELSTR